MIFDTLSIADGEREPRYAVTVRRNPVPTLKLRRGVRNGTLLISDIRRLSPRA